MLTDRWLTNLLIVKKKKISCIPKYIDLGLEARGEGNGTDWVCDQQVLQVETNFFNHVLLNLKKFIIYLKNLNI